MKEDADTAPQAAGPQPPSARGKALILLSFVGVYGIACALPAFYLTGRRDLWSGMEVMVIGPCALRFGQLGWLANLTALAALRCVMKGRPRMAVFLTAASVGLGLHVLSLPGKVIPLGPEEFNEVRIVSIGSGYYVWMAALLIPGQGRRWEMGDGGLVPWLSTPHFGSDGLRSQITMPSRLRSASAARVASVPGGAVYQPGSALPAGRVSRTLIRVNMPPMVM
jgi:hypothetical protein